MKDDLVVILSIIGICLIYIIVFFSAYWGRITHERNEIPEHDLENVNTNPMTIPQ